MAKIRVRKESNKLFIDFRCQGVRFREQTLLDNTSKNRKQLEVFLRRVEAKMMLEEFDYEEFFPGSSNLQKLRSGSSGDQEEANTDVEKATPFFSDFANEWLEDCRVQWRKSHTRNVNPSSGTH